MRLSSIVILMLAVDGTATAQQPRGEAVASKFPGDFSDNAKSG